jgi:D-alanyl-lipoteichoic acid acyltransferase DltB (MBOAT superfamily)
LLVASFIFYAAWDVRLLFLVIFVSAINYGVSLFFSYFSALKRYLLISIIIINFTILGIFKYANFLGDMVGGILVLLGFAEPEWEWHIILPLGISFYMFQATGYAVDVYKGNQKPERNFLKFSLFITFFPQMVAGPIERASRLLPQLFTEKKLSYANLAEGSRFILLGLFKKVVIADRIAAAVNMVYNNPTHHAGLPSLMATFLFAFQIYCDFSGYSDIAVGCAKILGIDLTQNFRQPYFSKSIKEFWRRWHVSLSAWFKDYVYFPLGGNRVSKPRHYFNTMVTFLVSGLWHGANITFIVWGALHGVYQIISDILGRAVSLPKNAFFKSLGVVLTFLLVCFAWIFFRANTTSDAIFIARNILSDTNLYSIQYFFDTINSLGLQLLEIILGVMAIGFLLVKEYFAGTESVPSMMAKTPAAVRWGWYLILAMAIASTGVFVSGATFIYFQF